MVAVANSALKQLLQTFSEELVLAQVLITRLPKSAFELRHTDDRASVPEALRLVLLKDLRDIAQKAAAGAFRPLKSAPNLRSGWRCIARDETEFDFALNCLYPNVVADWFAAQSSVPPIINYRAFTGRQTGMYRITTKLSDSEASQAIRACCALQFCLKQRLWTVEGLAPDDRQHKSLIPCLEPCAILLEFARTVARLPDGAENGSVPAGNVPEADFSAPDNPRRIQLRLEQQKDIKA